MEVLGIVTFTSGMYTMLAVYSTTMSSRQEQKIELEMTDPVVIPLKFTPKNDGILVMDKVIGLESELTVSVCLLSNGHRVIVKNETSVTLPPGSNHPMNLELRVPLSKALMYLDEGAEVYWETEIEVKTLYNLISFSNKMLIQGEEKV
jgi:hypothetical protein